MSIQDLQTFQNSEEGKNKVLSFHKKVKDILEKILQEKNKMSMENISEIYEICVEIDKELNLDRGMNLSMIFNRLNMIYTLLTNEAVVKSDRFEKFNDKINTNTFYGILAYFGQVLEKAGVDIKTLNKKIETMRIKTTNRFTHEYKYKVEKILYSS